MRVLLFIIVMTTSFLTSCSAASEHEIINDSVRHLPEMTVDQMASCQIALENILSSGELDNADVELRDSVKSIHRFWQDAVVFNSNDDAKSLVDSARTRFSVDERSSILENCLNVAEETMNIYDVEDEN